MKLHSVATRLSVAFGALILILVGIGWFGMGRKSRIDANLNELLSHRWEKAELGREAAGLIATDGHTSTVFENSNGQNGWGNHPSNVGASYTLIPLVGGFDDYGVLRDDLKARELGTLGAEALLDSLIVVEVLKPISGRNRPDAPSGHAIESWALASLSLFVVFVAAFTTDRSAPPDRLNLWRAGITSLVDFFAWFGELGIFCWRFARGVFVPPFEGRELVRQMDAIGSKSLPLVALAGAATGVVLSLHTRDTLSRFGAKSMLPAVIIFSILKESGPVITGLIVSGRVGAGIGAELGSMKVTEQIDAMEASAVDPYKYLVATRVLACIAMLPLLTLTADFCGILMGWISNTLVEPISLRLFVNTGTKGVTFSDFLPPTFKTAIYGLIIGIVSCFQGMRTQGGTEGVGRSTTSAVVLSSLFIILADVVLVRLIQVFFP